MHLLKSTFMQKKTVPNKVIYSVDRVPSFNWLSMGLLK